MLVARNDLKAVILLYLRSRRNFNYLSETYVFIFCLYSKFRLSYYPHRLENFMALLKTAFFGKCQQLVFGDFKQYAPGQKEAPCYFIHVVKKTA